MKVNLVINGEMECWSEVSIEAFQNFEDAYKRYKKIAEEIWDDEDYFVRMEELDLQ